MGNNYINENNNENNIIMEQNKKTNIIAMSIISLFMNFASGMIVSSANNFLQGQLNCSKEFLGVVRGGAEGMGNLFKIIFGMLSDYFKNRKIFLIIGYGGMFILKPMFGLTALPYLNATLRLFIYGTNHACDRILNAMRDGVRDASIYESSNKNIVGKSLGLRKFMACLGSTLGGIFSFFMLKKIVTYTDINKSLFFSKMYFSTIIPVSIAMFILIFFVKDVFQEKYKEKNNNIFINDYQSENILLGSMIENLVISFILGFVTVLSGIGLINLLCQWSFTFTKNLILLQKISQNLSIFIIILIIIEIILVKLYPKFFHKDSMNKSYLSLLNSGSFFFAGSLLGHILLLILNNGHTIQQLGLAIKQTFFNYGLNITVIIPFMLFFRWIFYLLYNQIHNTLEFYSTSLKKYDKIIILNFILSFGKYSDIFLFQHITTVCKLKNEYQALLFAFLYFIFGFFSYFLGKLSDGFFKKYSLSVLIIVNLFFNITAGFLNMIPQFAMLNYIFGILSLMLYGIYVGFIDCVLVSTVSKAIPFDGLLATLLGLFYLLIGVGNTCASYLIGTVFPNPTIAYRWAIIPGIIGLVYLWINKKDLCTDKD